MITVAKLEDATFTTETLSIRDQFALAAMQALLNDNNLWPERIAEYAYQQADLMMKMRKDYERN